MGRKLQQPNEALLLGKQIDEARIARHLTLEKLALLTGVHKGQLSRFCQGDFKTESPKLQIVLKELQIPSLSDLHADATNIDVAQAELIDHVTAVWRKAGTKRGAYVAAIRAIERLVV